MSKPEPQSKGLKTCLLPPDVYGSKGRPRSGKPLPSPLPSNTFTLEMFHKTLQDWPQISGSEYIVGILGEMHEERATRCRNQV